MWTPTHMAHPSPKMFSPPPWSPLKMILKPRRKEARIGMLLNLLAQALPCGSVGPLVGQCPITPSQREPGFDSGTGKVALPSLIPAHSFSKMVPCPGYPSPETQRAGCTFLDSLQVPTRLSMRILPKEVFSFETAHRVLLTF